MAASPGVLIEGWLSRQTLFGWQRRFVTLLSDGLMTLRMDRDFLQVGTLQLTGSTVFSNSSARDFCFSLKTTSTSSSSSKVLFAAEDFMTLESWKCALTACLEGLGPSLAASSSRPDSLINSYAHAKPLIYIKVVQARNLLPSALERTVDAYVKITLGASSVRTISRKKSLSPEFGQVFSLDWDNSMRFLTVEVLDESSSDAVLGVVQLNVLSFLDGDCNSQWHALSRRSKSSLACGEIQLEMSCAGQPDPEQLMWQLFHSVQRTAFFSMPLVSRESMLAPCSITFIPERGTPLGGLDAPVGAAPSPEESTQGLADYDGFPLSFPPIESEVLEDCCTRVSLVSGAAKHGMRGVLFLTNYRLLFLTAMRALVHEHAPLCAELANWDVSLQVPVAGIVSVSITSDGEPEMVVKTPTTRLNFVFHTSGTVSFEQLRSTSLHTIQRLACVTGSSPLPQPLSSASPASSASSALPSPLAAAFARLLRSDSLDALEATSSSEGPAAQRIAQRIKMRSINRLNEQATALVCHKRLIDAVRRSTSEVPLPVTTDLAELSHGARHVLLQSQRAADGGAPSPRQPLPIGWSGDAPDALFDASPEEALRAEASMAGLERRLVNTPLQQRLNVRACLLQGSDVYDPYAEFRRMGVMTENSGWDVTDLNVGYKLCSTYPSVLAVPEGCTADILAGSAAFRAKNRIPTLAWRNPQNRCTISRASQPLPGLTQSRNHHDETLVRLISHASTPSSSSSSASSASSASTPCFVIVDARPYANAVANQVNGKGFEVIAHYHDGCTIQFMTCDNIHSVRNSYESLVVAASEHDKSFAHKAEASGWLKHIRKIIKAANFIVHHVAFLEQSCLVHCSDGWDRTAKLTSLSMLLLDAHYRTLRGFLCLIEKEWISFGHRFAERSFCASVDGFRDEQERSAVFPLWLDCVHQCLLQYPAAFEFNTDLLLFLHLHLTSGWFGTFLFNSERERSLNSNHRLESLSIWTAVFANQARFTNDAYSPQKFAGILVPAATRQRIVIWQGLFGQGGESAYRAAWLHSVRTEEEDLHSSGVGSIGGGGEAGTGVAWVDDKDVSNCRACTNRFSLFKRKHHCRRCGFVYCADCCSEMRVLHTGQASQRCCSDCAKSLDEASREANPAQRQVLLGMGEAFGSSGL